METDRADNGNDYEVRAAPPGSASQGGTGEMVVLPGPRPRSKTDDEADLSVPEEPEAEH